MADFDLYKRHLALCLRCARDPIGLCPEGKRLEIEAAREIGCEDAMGDDWSSENEDDFRGD